MLSNELAKKHEYYNNTFFGKWARLYDYEKYFLFPIRKKAALFFPLKPPNKIIDLATKVGLKINRFTDFWGIVQIALTANSK